MPVHLRLLEEMDLPTWLPAKFEHLVTVSPGRLDRDYEPTLTFRSVLDALYTVIFVFLQ